MASNNPSNNVKHKIHGYVVAFSKTKNKWVAKNGNKSVFDGNFKECEKHCKQNSLTRKKMSFDEYLQQVKNELKFYGIDINDCTHEDAIRETFNRGDETPKEFVNWIATHYDLEKIK